ncbi:heparinase II/III-family protein [Pseudomonas sp. 10B1]|uniref:heparinase II/III family protein n=1 Tax=unclassified Pseudomonas TaxID=196821 RepID=UPI002B229BC2|nr:MULTISPECIES: heparinase II/III-family protein [unclassified Pseudomonas]MEA9997372.1 heparinase II/III-family protein [Pseudomonas sp. AA4]MEB0089400.1 heparinase II/III-family protein [Pseudomonas sp. RTI1]MEB0128554.1 heparinase II/III-family protein [Pseudomonas sp. CCC1.2]MEB0155834.1 heparinase II/III-family protein [Pseudomonas sp. CCC4.3]MEB0222008.1 heparinase II/III-family protein [Pseudomonas sp. AB12(2023)]
MKSLLIKIKTAAALGFDNIFRAVFYRIGIKIGINPVRRLTAKTPLGPFFEECLAEGNLLPYPSQWNTEIRYFGFWLCPLSFAPPNWHLNPLNGKVVPEPKREWWKIADFDADVGDIKNIWEASRFDWVLAFAQKATSEGSSLARLNLWLADWCQNNEPYFGPNWKCGQEASIRVMHLAMAAIILDADQAPLQSLSDLVSLHLERIEPTLSYAIAQDNNHGTSEAAALFIGGSWLSKFGHRKGAHWERLGRKWLENRAGRLVEEDGSFSQYSANYHRVMLDTFSMVEIWRVKQELVRFSSRFETKVKAAANWLYTMCDQVTGDVPNIGANDGARLMLLTDTDFRDFRPSIQLSVALFSNLRAYASEGDWDLPLKWLNLNIPVSTLPPPGSQLFNEGGYGVLRIGDIFALLRFPRFRFRPSQADALHVDLWRNGICLLCDAGSYSYHSDDEWLRYFPGTISHNTIQFDDRDQMPRLSRFLFGNWLKTTQTNLIAKADGMRACSATYVDSDKVMHSRRLLLSNKSLKVTDNISGFSKSAVLRWRLKPGKWIVDGSTVTKGTERLVFTTDVRVVRFEVVQGWESRYYLQKDQIPVLEVEVLAAGTLTTEYYW